MALRKHEIQTESISILPSLYLPRKSEFNDWMKSSQKWG